MMGNDLSSLHKTEAIVFAHAHCSIIIQSVNMNIFIFCSLSTPYCPAPPYLVLMTSFPTLSKGWGEPWGEPSTPATTVDNGTSAWGKPIDSGPSWGEPIAAASNTSTWGSSSVGPQALSKSGKLLIIPGGSFVTVVISC